MSKNIGLGCFFVFVISFVLPYISIGNNSGTLFHFMTETDNNDWIGVLLLCIGSGMLYFETDKTLPLIITIVGGFFPIYRFYKVLTVDLGNNAFSQAFAPSFSIGGYLILVAIFVQLYAASQKT